MCGSRLVATDGRSGRRARQHRTNLFEFSVEFLHGATDGLDEVRDQGLKFFLVLGVERSVPGDRRPSERFTKRDVTCAFAGVSVKHGSNDQGKG